MNTTRRVLPVLTLLAAAGALFATSVSAADIYKWVDKNGVTNYSSSPPAHGTAQTVDLSTTTVSIYPTPSAPDLAGAQLELARRQVAVLKEELQAEREARLARQAPRASTALPARCGPPQDCDADRNGVAATPYFFAPSPVFVLGRSFPRVVPISSAWPATSAAAAWFPRMRPISATTRPIWRPRRHPPRTRHGRKDHRERSARQF